MDARNDRDGTVAAEILPSYLARIGESAPVASDLSTLHRLQQAHLASIPFENLDILLGRGIHLDLERLADKLIRQRRGGYCFEQNTLLCSALREIGFAATPLEARVRSDGATLLPRTHMVLSVEIAGVAWLVDAGFGGEGPHEPVAMSGAESTRSAGLTYRVVRDGDHFVLQMRGDAGWNDQYAFLRQPVYPIDFKVANWYTSTHPSSPFVRNLTAQRVTGDVRYVLRYPSLTEIRTSGTRSRTVDREELLPLLHDLFLIDLPRDTVIPAIDAPAPAAPGLS